MNPLLALLADAAIFILLAWAVWRALGRTIPIAVVPIIIGLLLAGSGLLPKDWGVPSVWGDRIGWVGVLLLAFTAGLESRHFKYAPNAVAAPARPASHPSRFLASAAVALLLPFVAGLVAAYFHFTELPNWAPPGGSRWLGSLAIGLCVAVSALPVLIGIVRELGPLHRPLTQVAVSLAVVDDVVLWSGLALLLLVANSGVGNIEWSALHGLALLVPVAMAGLSSWIQKSGWTPPAALIVVLLPAFLVAGAWSSSTLGLHELLGAYFAGVIVPPNWTRRVPVETMGRMALMALAPLFFGHSGLKIDGEALGWASLQASALLLVLSAGAKLLAVIVCPPVAGFSRRETLAVGALLQCKGLMEIVAATILRDKGLLSEHAFAALVTLAVLSTLLTGPAFRFILRQRAETAGAHRTT